MRIRASVLTPILAMLTVVALIGTGIALGQSHRGEASATLLDTTPDFATNTGTDVTVMAEAGPPESIVDESSQPSSADDLSVQSPSTAQVVNTGSKKTATVSRPATTPAVTPAATHEAPAEPSADTATESDESTSHGDDEHSYSDESHD